MRFVEYTIDTNVHDEEELYALDPKLAAKHGRNPNEVHSMESLDMIWTSLPSNSHKVFITLYELSKNSENEQVQYHELLEEMK